MIDGDASAAIGRTTATEPVRRPARGVVERADPLSRLADDLRRLVKEIGVKPKPRAVHQLRTTIRRFETLLPEPDATAPRTVRKLRKQLDRIRKRAGKVRDADVHLSALRSLPRSPGSDARARVRGFLAKERLKRQRRLVRALAAERGRGLSKRLRQVVGHAHVARPDAAAADRILVLVRERFGRALQAAAPLGAENLHAFRLQTKRLRYLAETAAPHPVATTMVAQLKQVQDAIGAWHDWLTLTARAEQVLGDVPSDPLLAAMRARIERQLEKALAVTARAGRRLERLRLAGSRKGARPVTAARPTTAMRSAGASA